VTDPDGPVETLRRWEAFGGVWRVAYRDGSLVTLSLCRCDGGEEVERVSFEDPGLVAWIDSGGGTGARAGGEGTA